MAPEPPRRSSLILALTLVVGLAICAVAAGIMVPVLLGRYADVVLVAGTIALVGATFALGLVSWRRGRSLW